MTNTVDYVRRPQEAARILGNISTRTLRRMELAGKITATHITARIKGFKDSEINRVIAEGSK